MAQTTKNMQVQAGNANANVTAVVSDSMPGVPCPGPAGYTYKGLRYVPKFADPIEWSSTNTYESLTIVINEGNSYTSKQAVPVGVDISNETYWALTGNYNAQVEVYRRDTAHAQETADNALTSASTANGKADGNMTAITQTNTNLNNLKKRGLIVIGDSYADGSTNGQWVATWPQDVANALGAELEMRAVRGNGWVKENLNSTLLSQCQDAATAKTFANYGQVDIIVYGGVNDINAASPNSEVKTNMATGLKLLSTAYPKASIHVGGVNLGIENIASRNYSQYYIDWEFTALEAGGNVVFHDARGWLCTDSSSYASDKLHPTGDHGNDILKMKWLSIIKGSEWHQTKFSDILTPLPLTGSNDWILNLLNNGRVWCSEGRYRFESAREPLTNFNNQPENAQIGFMNNKGTATYNGVFGNSDIINSLPPSSFDVFIRMVNIPICFKVFMTPVGNNVNAWFKILSTPSAQQAPSGSYSSATFEWSIF